MNKQVIGLALAGISFLTAAVDFGPNKLPYKLIKNILAVIGGVGGILMATIDYVRTRGTSNDPETLNMNHDSTSQVPIYINTAARSVNNVESGSRFRVGSGKALNVHFSSALLSAINEDEIMKDIRETVAVVQDPQIADFLVDVEDSSEREEDTKTFMAVFTTTLKIVTQHGLGRLPHTMPVDPDCVADVLRAAARWKQHVETSKNPKWAEDIRVEFVPLQKVHVKDVISLQPLNPINDGENEATINVKAPWDVDEYYGMTLRNNCGLDLHVSIVVFDLEELMIVPWHTGFVGKDIPLPKGEYMPIGYGNSSISPFQFESSGGSHVSFLKLYFTPLPMDLEWLQQTSPFDPAIARGLLSKANVSKPSTDPDGATILFTVVQHTLPS